MRNLIISVLLLSIYAYSPSFSSIKSQPNIILIMTDDQGWGQTGYNNHPVLDTPNLDGIYIGPADLSLAIGEEPGFDKPEGTKAFEKISTILDAAKKRNLLAGIHNGTAEYAKKMISKGFDLVTIGSDQRFMSAGAKAAIESIKGIKKGQESKGY